MVMGDYRNIKITTPEDIILAGQIIDRSRMSFRVGIGHDVHGLYWAVS